MKPESLQKLALPHVSQLHAYTPGLQPKEQGWTKLNTNESPYPPSPRVAEALLAAIGSDGHALRLYPSPASSAVRETVAALHGVRPEQVCIGNGSDDLLNLLVRCCNGPAADAGFLLPSYSLYPVLVGIQHGASVVIAFDRSMRLPVGQIVASGARVFFLTSPNAPTGVGFSNAEIAEVLERFDGLLVVDEAYAPFARENAVPLLARHPNLVIVRTLSKSYGLAGIRVGYALAHPEIIGLLDRVRDSYNVSRLSQVAAVAALEDQPHHVSLVNRIKATRDHYAAHWSGEKGWFTYPSQANFLFTEPRNRAGATGPAVAKSAYQYLFAHKVLVRYFPSHALTDSFLRISVGTVDEMNILNQTLEAWQTHA